MAPIYLIYKPLKAYRFCRRFVLIMFMASNTKPIAFNYYLLGAATAACGYHLDFPTSAEIFIKVFCVIDLITDLIKYFDILLF